MAKWQSVLGSRVEDTVAELDGYGRQWCEQTKLQCLIRGAALSDEDECKDINAKLNELG